MSGSRRTEAIVGWGAVVAPLLHSFTDAMEWWQGGFSPPQLWLNYLAFLLLPAVVLGLYAVQRPRIGELGLVGALLYGFAFIYFAHTTLVALDSGVADYAQLWHQLGPVYTLHGALMLVGGTAFAVATIRARVLSGWAAWVFLSGLGINLAVALLPLPELLQTLGSTVRNIGLAAMGIALVRGVGFDSRPRGDRD